MTRTWILTAFTFLAVQTLSAPAWATFHFMQIEQIIGGVDSDPSAQAIQLRMRSVGQNLLNGQGVLRVRDAAGNNPITVTDFPLPNPNSGECGRILIASANFAGVTTPAVNGVTRDYVMANLIPPSYLAAGTLTFEDLLGTVLWRVSWGGASYTGPNTGSGTNTTGFVTNFGSPFAGPLPSTGHQALLFTGACPPATSNGNSTDYSLTAGNAVFTNNDANAFTVTGTPVPTVSQWGVMAMALSVLVCGTLVVRGRRAEVV